MRQKFYVQRFRNSWLDNPNLKDWLCAVNQDDTKAYCKYCKCSLKSKLRDLLAHADTKKHINATGRHCELKNIDKHDSMDEEETADHIEDESEQVLEMDGHYSVEYNIESAISEVNDTKFKTHHIQPLKKMKLSTSTQKKKDTQNKSTRLKILQRIEQDRYELNEYFSSRRRTAQSPTPRDPFDLFFDSICASVKALPPKLAAEVKGRISQILTEFELRAICEQEACQGASIQMTSIAVSTSTQKMETGKRTESGDLAASIIRSSRNIANDSPI